MQGATQGSRGGVAPGSADPEHPALPVTSDLREISQPGVKMLVPGQGFSSLFRARLFMKLTRGCRPLLLPADGPGVGLWQEDPVVSGALGPGPGRQEALGLTIQACTRHLPQPGCCVNTTPCDIRCARPLVSERLSACLRLTGVPPPTRGVALPTGL